MSGHGAGPVLSVVVEAAAVDPRVRVSAQSVLNQTEDEWELLLVLPSGQSAEATPFAEQVGDRVRVIVHDGGRQQRRGAALAVCRGQLITFLRPSEQVVPRTVRALKRVLREHPTADLIYADEEARPRAAREAPEGPGNVLHKPSWSPERLRSQDYLGGAVVYRTTTVREVGFRGDAAATDHDLALRMGEVARTVVHEPQVLWQRDPVPEPSGEDWEVGRQVVADHLARTGRIGEVRLGKIAGTYEIRREVDPDALVSVVIPTRGSSGPAQDEQVRCYVLEAVESLVRHAGHEHLEVVVVHDVQTPRRVIRQLRTLLQHRLVAVPYDEQFNFSRACNRGVVASHGSMIVLLNDDVEIISPDFLPRLLGPLADSDVGMTGAKLLYEDGTLQHAGISMPAGGPWHAFRGWGADEPGPGGQLQATRECVGVTGACLAMRRFDYDDVGGLTEELPLSYNDVDLCLKVAAAGLRRVWVADAVAYHYESKSRDPQVTPYDKRVLRRRWALPARDPYFPPGRVAFRRRLPA